MSASQIDTLNFKDEVELLDTSGGWGRIRKVQSDIVGWSNKRYLVPVKANHQQSIPRHLAPGPEKPIDTGNLP